MQHREWLARYRHAWIDADAAALRSLFTPDAVERGSPFSAEARGVDAIVSSFEATITAQAERDVALGEPIIDDGTAVLEWWATLADRERGAMTIPGVLIVTFAQDGRCSALRRYQAATEGRHQPFVEWGLVAAGETRRTRRFAARWVAGYAQAWRAGDVEAAVGLFSDDVVYRSHPFRTPERGRHGVRRYTTAAFFEERDVVPLMWTVAVSNGVAAVEYWTTRRERGEELTLAGCDILTFERDGECRALREYWQETAGLLKPPAELTHQDG